jgi:hypothetical protein
MDPKNNEEIIGRPTPNNNLEFRSFMSLACYYRRFIAGFSMFSHSMTSLEKKGIQFKWIVKCEGNFHLKDLLTSALMGIRFVIFSSSFHHHLHIFLLTHNSIYILLDA